MLLLLWKNIAVIPLIGLSEKTEPPLRVNIPLNISANGLSGEGRIQDLSLSGALVKAEADLRLYALVKVSIDMAWRSQKPAQIMGYVSRKKAGGVGVEWCEFAPSIVKDLLRSPSIPLPS